MGDLTYNISSTNMHIIRGKWHRSKHLDTLYDSFYKFLTIYLNEETPIFVKRGDHEFFYQERNVFITDRVLKIVKALNKIFPDSNNDTYAIPVIEKKEVKRINWMFLWSAQERILMKLMTNQQRLDYIDIFKYQLEILNPNPPTNYFRLTKT